MPDGTQGDLFPIPHVPEVTRPEIVEILQYWATVMGKKRVFLDTARIKVIRNALKFGATVEECKRAIDGCKASRWHMGDNDRRIVYNELALILRDAEHIERFCEIADRAKENANRVRVREAEYTAPKRGMPEWVREEARHLRLLKTA